MADLKKNLEENKKDSWDGSVVKALAYNPDDLSSIPDR